MKNIQIGRMALQKAEQEGKDLPIIIEKQEGHIYCSELC